MRQFKLINSVGAEYDLMHVNHFLHKPDGLGFKKDIEFVRIGNSFKAVDIEMGQQQITGEMIFAGYAEYLTFQQFIVKSPVTLCYKPIDTWYYKDGYIGSLDKTEIDRTSGKLICDLDFYPTTMWYIPAVITQLIPDDVGNAKVYPFTYDFEYFESAGGIINLVNNGTTEASCEIGIYGPVTNPCWRLVINGATTKDGKMNATINSGYYLVISSRDSEYSIKRYQVGSATGSSLLANSDLNTERFIKVPIGTSQLILSDDTYNTIKAYVKVYQEYETV